MTARRRNIGLAIKVALAALWLVAASRVHVNASWSDGSVAKSGYLVTCLRDLPRGVEA